MGTTHDPGPRGLRNILLLSGIYLAVAIWKPRWDGLNNGRLLAPSTANLLCAFFAKTIELAYVTICVAFLGQVLSRKAMMKRP